MSRPKTIYGVPLGELPLGPSGVPDFLKQTCDYLVGKATTLGIFRLSGSQTRIDELGELFYNQKLQFVPPYGVHEYTGALKKWLHDLPEPLISPEITGEFLKPNDKRSVLEVLRRLKDLNRKCLALVIEVIKAVVDHSSVNQMDFRNITTCFLGSLVQGPKWFPFQLFYETSSELLDADDRDFLLEGPFVEACVGPGLHAFDSAPAYSSGVIQFAQTTKLEPPQKPMWKTIPSQVKPRTVRPSRLNRSARYAQTVSVEEIRKNLRENVEE